MSIELEHSADNNHRRQIPVKAMTWIQLNKNTLRMIIVAMLSDLRLVTRSGWVNTLLITIHHAARPLSGRNRRFAFFYTSHWATRIDGKIDASSTVLNIAKSYSLFELESTDRWHDC